jgi:hypothetical protein
MDHLQPVDASGEMPHPHPPRCAERGTMASRLQPGTAAPGTILMMTRDVEVPLSSRQRGEGTGGAFWYGSTTA